MSTASTKKSVIVAPFGVEIDHPRNCDVLIQSIPGRLRMRGGISAAKPSYPNPKNKRVGIPKDQARHLGSFPQIPGMQIFVNPAALSYYVIDPLHDNEELCKAIADGLNSDESVMRATKIEKIEGVPKQTGKLNEHRMKTLCRELAHMVDIKFAKVVKGTKPELEDVDELPGNYLLNPGSTIPNSQPVFEKDVDSYLEQINKTVS